MSKPKTRPPPKPLHLRKKPERELSQKERIFIAEYIATQNGTQSAIKAGYTTNENSASQLAYQLLKKAHIRGPVKKELDRIYRKSQFKAEEVMLRLKEISDVDVAQCYYKSGELKPLHKIPVHVRKAISSVEVQEIKVKGRVVGHIRKVKFWDKNKALELSGKHLKLFGEADKAPPAVNNSVVVVLPPKNEGGK